MTASKDSQPLRIGIAGLGRAGWGMIYEEVKDRPDIEIAAGFDAHLERAKELQDACGATPYDNLDAMLNDQAVELVVVATASLDHAPASIRTLEAGKHVLVEKPMAVNLRDADAMIEAAGKSPGRLLVRHNRRFDPPLVESKKIIASGKIGEVFRVQLRQGGYGRRADWQTALSHGGGQLLNWGPHLVDWATQLIGPAAEVWSDLRRVNAAGDAEDQVRLMLRSGSGAIADLEFGGACALPQPGWHVLGTLGAFQIDNKTATLRYIDLDAAPDAPTLNTEAPPRGNGFGGGKLEFIEASYEIDREVSPGFWDAVVATLRHDEPFPITLDQARENMRIIDAARQGTPFQMTEAEPMICSG